MKGLPHTYAIFINQFLNISCTVTSLRVSCIQCLNKNEITKFHDLRRWRVEGSKYFSKRKKHLAKNWRKSHHCIAMNFNRFFHTTAIVGLKSSTVFRSLFVWEATFRWSFETPKKAKLGWKWPVLIKKMLYTNCMSLNRKGIREFFLLGKTWTLKFWL